MVTETIIQNIILPTSAYERTRLLYVKGYEGHFPIFLSRGEEIDFRTFFNLFPSEKYRNYAGLDHVILRLDCKGNPMVEISRYGGNDDSIESFRYTGDHRIELGDECLLGMIIKADESDIIINGGYLYSDSEDVSDIHLAHVICTYHREKDITEKLDWICSECNNNPFMKNHLKVYVIDNGNTLDYHDDCVNVIKSPNLGGSGGFSRGMMEAINDGISTHLTLNDDDAMLDPETIRRTMAFYSLLKDERKETILGGTIFDKDNPLSVHEAGAFCKSGKLYFNEGMDPTTVEGCMQVENGLKGDEDDAYIAWCYMSMPCSVVRENGLSLPVFFQCDDVDFSLRIRELSKITMCGICVWHPFLKIHSVNKEYFGIRNMLTAMASNSLMDCSTVKNAFLNTMVSVGCCRYKTAEAQLKALHDFRTGPERVFGMIEKGYSLFIEYEANEPVVEKKLATRNIVHSKRFNIMTFNGILFPSIGNLETDMSSYETYLFYRKGIIYYIMPNGKEAVCKRSLIKAMTLTSKIVWNIVMIMIRRNGINHRYSKAAVYYSSEKKWSELFEGNDTISFKDE